MCGRVSRKHGDSWLRTASILLVLSLAALPLGAWPTRQASGQQTQIQVAVPDQTKTGQSAVATETPSLGTTSLEQLQSSSTALSQAQSELLAYLKSADNADASDLTELKATLEQVKNLVSIQQAAYSDLQEQYRTDLAAVQDKYSSLQDDYKKLSKQYDNTVLALGKAQGSDKTIKQYRATFGGSVLYNSEDKQMGYGADIGIRFLGPLSLTGGAVYYPDKGLDGLTFKAGIGWSF
ncbi:hypothetical protein SpiGrapes_1114 [Sphaerochaeta pleomorpha str. Grapes]|uniref:Uncharacterized protein n=2 Tax=Sphaerochaeta TaxID=399320 RepID=G8QS73_SPHPG|nr:hypothetical protein SpiGrapes_1114 [Sphaerochaeta pleomorpha str. Grapes]